ncbi:hypothetical protein TNCV_2611161 [Trichonephila clavipes]|nr:hypothetical protein TNCV_2611161 [Trichonephila clavipes]
MTTVPEPNPVEVWCVVLYLDIESCAIAGRVDHQHLFSLSVGIRGKIHLCGCNRSDRFFFPYSGKERVKRHRSISMKFLAKVVTPKCLSGPRVDRDRLNAHTCCREEGAAAVDSDNVQELQGSYNQYLTIDERIKMHEHEQDTEELSLPITQQKHPLYKYTTQSASASHQRLGQRGELLSK